MVEAVVLLHGMGRSWISMALLGLRLRRSGYETHLFGYSPRRESLDELSQRLKALIDNEVKASAYNLIGHSLGNIIVRNTAAGNAVNWSIVGGNDVGTIQASPVGVGAWDNFSY